MLVAVARAIAECVRIDEFVARRGGDEFAVVIADADPGYVNGIVERVSAAIIRARERICPDVAPTASVAVAAWEPGDSADQLLHRADLALHEAKVASKLAHAA